MGAAYRSYTNKGTGINACSYYRQVLPMAMMEKLGLPIQSVLDDNDAQLDRQIRAAIFMESDFTLQYQCTGTQSIALMEMGKKLKAMKDGEGNITFPPTFILDSDDDIFNVMPLNVTFASLGTRRWDGTPLEDGDEIGIAHPAEVPDERTQARLTQMHPAPLTGAKVTLEGRRYIYDSDAQWHAHYSMWRDGHNIDIAKNKERVENWKKALKLANLITVSTPRVKDAIEREMGEGLPFFVSPNAIDFDAYPEVELRENPNEVRILWEGSASHHEGLWPLNKTLGRLAAKYPQTTWYFFGAPYKWATQHLPAERVRMIPWEEYPAYKLRLSTLNHDISLAPLAMNTFNDSRSAIRWYENSAIWKPAATIAQNWAAYRDEIEDGKTAMLFNDPDELEVKLSALIEDAKLRQTLASNSKDWVRTHRDAKRIALRLYNKWAEVREEQKLTIPIGEAEEPVSAITQ